MKPGAAMRFPIRFSAINRVLMWLVGAGPRYAYVDLGDDTLRVRFGFGFSATIPRSSIASARRDRNVWSAFGVHGWWGRWIVNGSGRNIVAIAIDPPARARVLGVPVRLKELWVSLVDPEAFLAAIGR